MKKINDIIYSIKINYKSWLIFLLIIYFLSNNIFIGILNFIIFFTFSYIAHYISHSNYLEFYTIIHKYHHQKNNWFGFFNEIIYEFTIATGFTFLKIFIQFICNIDAFNFILNYINIPLNIFIFFFYTSVHYINYSALHVNNIHELHHKDVFKNMGPDICDIIFGTKYEDIKEYIENTDHYILNILVGLSIIYIFLILYEKVINKDIFKYIFIYIYILFIFILLISTLIIYLDNLEKKLKKDYRRFKGV